MIRPNELVITDANFTFHAAPPPDRKKGLIPRDFKATPRGFYASCKAVDVPLIDMSEWPDRIKDKEANKSRLSDVRLTGDAGKPIPSLDQDGVGYCATDDTEVLTERGWVPYPAYNWSDPIATVNPLTHRMEFQVPFQRHVYEYDGPMVYSTNRRLDFGVTPDHEMYVRKWDERLRTLSPHYSFVRAGDLGWYCGLLGSPSGWLGTELVELEVPGDRRYDGDDFLALLGLIVSDGYAGGSPNTRNWVSFASFRPDTLPGVRALAARVGFHESPGRPGVFVRYDAGALAEWVRTHCYTNPVLGAKHKRVPELVKAASVRQIKHFLHHFDDRSRDGRYFYSTSRRLIDDLQELVMRAGRRASIGVSPPKETEYAGKTIRSSGGFVLTVGETGNLCLERKKHIETDRYKGLVYCAGVPNHTLITRRNGSVLISSNCWAHSSTSANMLLRALAGLPYVPLSAFAVAATIKKGRDEGGWGAQSLDFLMARGQPSQAIWPQGDRNWSKYASDQACWDNAAEHKVIDGWIDLAVPVYDRQLSKQQVGTLLLSNVPVVCDYNWWSHSVLGIDLVDQYPNRPATDPSRYGIRIWNSWGDSWSDRGMGVLTDSKAWPDSAVAPRQSTVSAA